MEGVDKQSFRKVVSCLREHAPEAKGDVLSSRGQLVILGSEQCYAIVTESVVACHHQLPLPNTVVCHLSTHPRLKYSSFAKACKLKFIMLVLEKNSGESD